jgi:mono/diheme cytochrome c family protein
MIRSAAAFLLLLAVALAGAWPQGAAAQEPTLNAKETQGQALFAQHCVVCHFRTQITSPGQWGPPLSKATLGGDESLIREYITDGTPRMPGFKYNFRSEQIEAIAAFIKTLPVPPAAPATPPAR